MSSFFRQAQDPVSCATHAWGAVAAFFGGMVLLLRALWADVGMGTLAAAMVFAFSLMALSLPAPCIITAPVRCAAAA